jgi:hypothetical protein
MASLGIIKHQTRKLGMNTLESKITRTQTSFSINYGGKLIVILSFLFSRVPLFLLYILAAPTCTTTVTTLEPCVLNIES